MAAMVPGPEAHAIELAEEIHRALDRLKPQSTS
jgi:hypothetical protein